MVESVELRNKVESTIEVAAFMKALGASEGLLLTPLTGGCHNEVYLCENGPPDFPEKIVARVPNCPEAAHAAKASAALPEGLPAPQTLFMGRLSVSGALIVLEEYIDGQQKNLHALALEEVSELAARLALIHNHTDRNFSSTSGSAPTRSGTYGDYLRAMITESVADKLSRIDMSSYAAARQAIDAGVRRLHDLLETRSEIFSGGVFSLLHHDLNPGNILWGSNGLAYFIDWNPTFGDPADDVDYIITNNNVSPRFRNLFLEGYLKASGRFDIIDRIGAYTLKNQLDDLAWVIDMQQRFAGMPATLTNNG